MTQDNLPERVTSLSALIVKAAKALAGATTAAEVLDAERHAQFAYSAAKAAARFVEMGKAHAEIIAVCHRTMGDAILIEAQAKIRLADEFDAAQARGEAVNRRNIHKLRKGKQFRSNQGDCRDKHPDIATYADLGLTYEQLRAARTVRNANRDHPGMIEKLIDEQIKAGKSPERRIVTRNAKELLNPKPPKPKTPWQQDLDDRKAEIIALADGGMTAEQISREVDRVPRLVHRVLEVERARRGAPAADDKATLSMTAQQRLDTALRQAKKKLEAEFNARVTLEVRRRIEDTVLPSYNKSYKEYNDVIKSRKGIMDKATYRKLLFCVHPDRVHSLKDAALSKRFDDAFNALTKMEKLLLDEKESPTDLPPLPQTYDELMKVRAAVMEKRRMQRESKANVVRR